MKENSFQELFSYGLKLMFAGLIETLYRNLYTIVIGKYFKSDNLDSYSRGEQLAYITSQVFYKELHFQFYVRYKMMNNDLKIIIT